MRISVADAIEYDGEKHRREKRKELSKKKLVIHLFICPSKFFHYGMGRGEYSRKSSIMALGDGEV